MLKRGGVAQNPFRGLLNRRGLGPFTIPIILLHILSAIALLIFLLVLTGYAGVTVPKLSIANEKGLVSNYMADALISLPNWDGKCGCLAKSVSTTEGEVVYPRLIPKWKLDTMNSGSNCNNHFCVVPYFIDKKTDAQIHISVTDLEMGTAIPPLLKVGSGVATSENVTVTRLVAIEYPDGRVHAGRVSVTVLY